MTPIGLSSPDCRRALARYRCLVLALTGMTGEDSTPPALPLAFEDLRHQLEVDVLARATSTDGAAMSSLEARVVAPTLRAMRTRVEDLARGARPWRASLADLLTLLDGALRRLPAA